MGGQHPGERGQRRRPGAVGPGRPRARTCRSTSCMGGARDRVKAYASTYPNLGAPQVYAEHALQCKREGYLAYKIHPHYFWDPATRQPTPGRPSNIAADIETCRLVREAVGPDYVLMYDPWGTYHSLEEALEGRPRARRARLLLVRAPDAGVSRRELCAAGARAAHSDPVAGDRRRRRVHPRGVDSARRVGHEPHRRQSRRHHRRAQDGDRVRSVRPALRDPHGRLRQSASARRDQRRHQRVLRKGPARARRRLRRAASVLAPHVRRASIRMATSPCRRRPGLGYEMVWDYINDNLLPPSARPPWPDAKP